LRGGVDNKHEKQDKETFRFLGFSIPGESQAGVMAGVDECKSLLHKGLTLVTMPGDW
jgi:hypothetical protein